MQLIAKALILLAIAGSTSVHAAPALTGGSVTNGVLTITGTDLGTKTTPQPLHFDTFSEGVVGDTVGQHSTYWSEPVNPISRPIYSNDYVRTPGHLSVKATTTWETNIGAIWKNNVGFASTGKIYYNYWIRYDLGTSTGNYWQTKSLSIANSFDTSGNVTVPEVALFNFNYYDAGYTQGYIANPYYGSGSNAQLLLLNSAGSSHNVLNQQAWYNIIVQVDQGTPGQSDGYYSVSISDPTFTNPYGFNSRSNTMILGDSTNVDRKIDAIKVWSYLGPAPTVGGTSIHYYDSIYIDNSWARVEICDSPSYSTRKHCEIQIPQSWSSTNITATLKSGSFADDSSVYVYVSDEDGLINQTGYGPIVLNSSVVPAISNATINAGANTININGSGFGTKVSAAPILWDNFEDGVAGNALPTTGKWQAMASVGGWFSNPATDYLETSGNAYSGSLAAYNHFKVGPSGTNENFNTSYFVIPSPSAKLYYSYQWRWESSTSGNGRAVIKAGRINSNNVPLNYYNGPGVSALSTFDPTSSWLITASYGTTSTNPSVTMNQNINPVNYRHVLDEGSWHRHEMYKEMSTAGVEDGTVWFAVGEHVLWNDTTAQTRESGETYLNNSVLLGLMTAGMILGSDTEVRLWVDDVYVDNTPQRIELCNNSTKATSTHCEIQPPTTWNDISVTTTLNKGTFQAGDIVYVIAYDQDNNPSTGYGPLNIPASGLGWAKARMKLQN